MTEQERFSNLTQIIRKLLKESEKKSIKHPKNLEEAIQIRLQAIYDGLLIIAKEIDKIK